MLRKSYINSCFLLIFVLVIKYCYSQDEYAYKNLFKIEFTEASTMGLFVALAFPLDLPGREVYYSHFFEAIHNLPTNDSSYDYPPIIGSRDMDRQMIYNAFERKINSNGYPGKPCLLRTICEIAQYSVEETNGVLGEIVHIIFTPSSTKNFDLSPEYEEAEVKGRNQDCSPYSKDCSISLLDLISKLEDHFY